MELSAVNLKRLVFVSFLCLLCIDSSLCDVEQLEASNFDYFVASNKLVLILFKASDDCPTCNKALEYFEHIPQPDLVQTEIHKRYVTDDDIAARLGASDYPAIVFFRDSYPAVYHGKLGSEDDLPEFQEWLTQASEVATQELYDDSFEHLTQASTGATTGDWFVLFYEPSCEECLRALPVIENVAIRLKHRMNFARVNAELNKRLAKRFKVEEFPYGILFKQGKMYPYEPAKFDTSSIKDFVETWYRNVKSSPVPKEATAFDALTESIASYLKEQLKEPNKKLLFVIGAITASVMIIALIAVVFRKPAGGRRKFE